MTKTAMEMSMATPARRGAGMWLQLQAGSGLIIAAFVGMHLLNTFLLALSFATYDRVQAMLRQVYQQPLFEVLLALAIVLHMACGVRGMLVRRRERMSARDGRAGGPARLPARLRWQRVAGWFLLAAIGGHVAATRGAALWFDVAPGAEGLGFTMAFLPAYFYPYYFLLGLAGLYHGVLGIDAILARSRARVRIGARLRPTVLVGAVALAAALLGAGGVLYETPDPYANDYAALVLRLVGGAQ